MYLLAPFVFLLVYVAHTQPTVVPVFTCWYADFDPSNHAINLIFGANNTGSSPVTLPVNLTNDIIGNVSVLQPSSPVITMTFSPGLSPYILVVSDVYHFFILGSDSDNASVQWIINGSSIVSVTSAMLTSSTRCSYQPALANNCPTWIPYFCGDESYCNGHEICFPSVSGSMSGSCLSTTELIVCNSSNLVCSDTAQACVPTEAPIEVITGEPTEVPTSAPTELPGTPTPTSTPTELPETPTPTEPTETPTSDGMPTTTAPTGAPTELPETPIPTLAPTSAITLSDEEILCETDADCVNSSNFCTGAFICSNSSFSCQASNPSYDPCSAYEEALSEFYNMTNATSFPISIVCLAMTSSCVETFVCATDADCDDNVTCNGGERCLDGLCYLQLNQSLSNICNTSLPVYCTEDAGCLLITSDSVAPTTEAPTSPTAEPTTGAPTVPPNDGPSMALGIAAGVIVAIGLIVLIIMLSFEFSVEGSYVASMSTAKHIGISERILSKYSRAAMLDARAMRFQARHRRD